MGFSAAGALEGRAFGAVGIATRERSTLRHGRGFGPRLARIHFWGSSVCVEGVEVKLVCYIVDVERVTDFGVACRTVKSTILKFERRKSEKR